MKAVMGDLRATLGTLPKENYIVDRIATIRTKEKEYHDECYTTTELFEPGSWLHKPVKTIIDLLELFDHQTEVNVLDLGCGVGRNCIPITQRFLHKDMKISESIRLNHTLQK
jgi:SAM-dependent methyltransferase